MQGKAVAKRVGESKIAIITDRDVKIMAYGLNRNVLI